MEFIVERDEAAFKSALKEQILSAASMAPVIVFVDRQKKIDWIKPFVKASGHAFFTASTDMEMRLQLGALGGVQSGVMAVLANFGRGVDIRFAKDAIVVIGYLPARMSQINQMAGRSSRKMALHRCKIVC